jgi:hypothetical protein
MVYQSKCRSSWMPASTGAPSDCREQSAQVMSPLQVLEALKP